MPTNERIRRHLLQLDGLQSWPDNATKDTMVKWVRGKIRELVELRIQELKQKLKEE